MNSTRKRALSLLTSILGSLEQVGGGVLMIADIYREHHPEISAPLDELLPAILALSECLENVKRSI